MAAIALAQRHQLEEKTTALLVKILGLELDHPEPDLEVSASSAAQEQTVTAERFLGASGAAKREMVGRALRRFYDKMPYNGGAQNLLQDLLSCARSLHQRCHQE